MPRSSERIGKRGLREYTFVLAEDSRNSTPARSRLFSSFQTALYCALTVWVSALAWKRAPGFNRNTVSRRTRTRDEKRAWSTIASDVSITFRDNSITDSDSRQVAPSSEVLETSQVWLHAT